MSVFYLPVVLPPCSDSHNFKQGKSGLVGHCNKAEFSGSNSGPQGAGATMKMAINFVNTVTRRPLLAQEDCKTKETLPGSNLLCVPDENN
jgi:hypothetical protein